MKNKLARRFESAVLRLAVAVGFMCAISVHAYIFVNNGNCDVVVAYHFHCNLYAGCPAKASGAESFRPVTPIGVRVNAGQRVTVDPFNECSECPGSFACWQSDSIIIKGITQVGGGTIASYSPGFDVVDEIFGFGATITVDCSSGVTGVSPTGTPPYDNGDSGNPPNPGGGAPPPGNPPNPGGGAPPPGNPPPGNPPPPDDPPCDMLGMPRWKVSEPFLSLWLGDEPLSYTPAVGPRISFGLNYSQREFTAGYDTNLFGAGKHWNCPWLSLVETNTKAQKVVSFPGGSRSIFTSTNDYRTDTRLTGGTTTGYTLSYPDGSKNVYGFLVTNSAGAFRKAMMTEVWNSIGQKTRLDYYAYDPANAVIRLKCVVDGDGLTNWVYYDSSNQYSTNLINQVVDPFGRSVSLAYDHQGFLTNIKDVVGISSSLVYDTNGYVTNLVTPYGTTRFQYTDTLGTNLPPFGRSVRVLEPDGSCQLFLYTNGAPGIASSYSGSEIPGTSPFANYLDNSELDQRNSFHWNRQQYASLSTTNLADLSSTDFRIARMKHWLKWDLLGTNVSVSSTLSLVRLPSPDGTTEGQKTWYDYQGRTNSLYQGTQHLALATALLLPDGTTNFTRTIRNKFGTVTNEVSTCSSGASVALRTNTYVFAANEIDLLRATNALGVQVSSNAYNAYHQVLTNFDALNQKTVYTYDSSHRLTGILHPTGLLTTNTYGSDGFLAERADLGIATNSYTWSNDLVYTHTDPRALRLTNTWDALNRLRRVDFPDGTFVTNSYENLNLVLTLDRMGFTNSFGYDPLRRMTAATNANGVVSRYGFCGCGSLTFITNAWNTPVEYTVQNSYDLQGNLIYEVYPDRAVTNWFDSLRRKICTGDGWGYRWFFYNNQGSLTTISNDFGIERLTSFDILDRPQYVTDANGVMVTNTYDTLSRPLTRGYPDGGVEKFGYSARGMIAHTNQLGFTNFYAYDEAGQKTFETNANAEVIRYTNSPAGDLLALVDGKNQVTKWNYDEYGRVTNKLDQAGTEILRYVYDPDGHLASRWSMAKGTTYYTNDAVGNLLAINYSSSSDVSFAYDAMNRLTNMVDAVGTTKYTFSVAGRLLTEDGPFADDTVTNIYSSGLRTKLALQQPVDVWTNAFGYDSAKRLTTVTSPTGTFGYSFHQQSPLIHQLSLPNSSYITNTYNNLARLTGTWLKDSGNTVLDSAEYAYNTGNQRTGLTRGDSSTESYAYDRIGQLKVADSSVTAEDRGYSYDAAWNLNYRTNNGTLQTFTVDGKSQLTAEPSGACVYDSNGNLTNDAGVVYSYDDENRLVEWFQGGPSLGALGTAFAYDGLGRLRTRSEYHGDGSDWVLQSAVNYIYDGMRVIQERDYANTPAVSYTRGTDLGGTLESAGGIGGLLARSHGYSSGNWSTHSYYHADGNGNITTLVDGMQTLSASYRYDPFGNTISQSGSLADANVYRFSSKEFHAGSGLYYYGYRFYAPNLQRWVNRDPIEESGGLNLYGFVDNCPPDRMDPLGLVRYEWPCGSSAAAACRSLCGSIGVKSCVEFREVRDYFDEIGIVHETVEGSVCICGTPPPPPPKPTPPSPPPPGQSPCRYNRPPPSLSYPSKPSPITSFFPPTPPRITPPKK